MLATLRRSQHKFWRGWLTALVGVWLLAALAPCVSAATSTCGAGPCPSLSDSADMAYPPCETAQSVDCQLQSPQPISADFSFNGGAPSILLGLIAPSTLEPLGRSDLAHADSAARAAPPPLSLRPAVLLI